MTPADAAGSTRTEFLRSNAFARINAERDRQERLWAPRSCASPDVAAELKVAVLVEEVGEVARAVLDNSENLAEELTQVAAVAVAWLESLDGGDP